MTTQTIPSTDILDLDSEVASRSHASDGASRRRDRYKGTLEFRLIFAAAFVVFLLTSALERALPMRWSAGSELQAPRKSIIGQAKESASIAAGYAFMG